MHARATVSASGAVCDAAGHARAARVASRASCAHGAGLAAVRRTERKLAGLAVRALHHLLDGWHAGRHLDERGGEEEHVHRALLDGHVVRGDAAEADRRTRRDDAQVGCDEANDREH